jgi:maleylacetoacetate isomerase
MKLYAFFRSSASFRVRIVLNLKGLAYAYVPINLAGGESHAPAYEQVNPQGIVPTLEDNGVLIGQSLAICEYLEETHPTPPILPRDPAGRAVRALALAVACEIHRVGGGRAQNQIATLFKATPEQLADWMRYFISLGFNAIERMLAESSATGRFSHGDVPTLADAFLVPQVFNAEAAKVDLGAFPTIRRIYAECNQIDAFARARPERQPDAT